jgi:hypothetical protein
MTLVSPAAVMDAPASARPVPWRPGSGNSLTERARWATVGQAIGKLLIISGPWSGVGELA